MKVKILRTRKNHKKNGDKNEPRAETLNPNASSNDTNKKPSIELNQSEPMNVENSLNINENNHNVKKLFEIEHLMKELTSHVGVQTMQHHQENYIHKIKGCTIDYKPEN